LRDMFEAGFGVAAELLKNGFVRHIDVRIVVAIVSDCPKDERVGKRTVGGRVWCKWADTAGWTIRQSDSVSNPPIKGCKSAVIGA